MRLAVLVAAWSKRDGAGVALATAFEGLGFSVHPVPVVRLREDAPHALRAALAGVEETDTLVIHVSGLVRQKGAVAIGPEADFPLTLVADVLADKPVARSLVFVETLYDGEPDALRAVEEAEAIADALSSHAGSHTAVIAAHAASSDDGKLVFSHAVLEAARDVVQQDGKAYLDDAYAPARERCQARLGASAFALQRGGSRFPIAYAMPVVSSAPATLPSLAPPPPSAAPRSLPPPISARMRAASVPSPVSRPPAPPVSEAPAPATSEPRTVPETLSATATGSFIIPGDDFETVLPEVLEARIVAAIAAGDHRLAVSLCRDRLLFHKTVDAKVDELFEIGRTLATKLRDLPEAVSALAEARAIDPRRTDVLEALRRGYTKLERWSEAVDVTVALAAETDDPRERATSRVAAAHAALTHLADDERALGLLTAALEDDPTNEDALAELARLRRARGDIAELEQTLTKLAHNLVESGHPVRAWDACQRLASLRRDDLGDAAGAVEALAIAKRLPLSELDSRAVLAEQLLALGDDEGAIVELEAILAAEPGHVRACERLLSVVRRQGDQDRAYLLSLVLEELGTIDVTSREMLEAYRAEWGLRARAALDDAAWDALRAPGSDRVVEAVFRASMRAAIAAEYEGRDKRPPLDPSRRQPETSTASIVRCFHWASRALATPCPALYVLDEVGGGIAAVPAGEPVTALGPSVLRGLSSKTLAFLAARHLAYFRPEHQVLVHFPTAEAAAGLFFAAVELVLPGVYVPENLVHRVVSMKRRLARHLRPEEIAQLSDAVGQMESRDAKVDLHAWIRSVELTAGRAGLLLAGDLQTALAQVKSEERGLSGLSADERRVDLLTFALSRTLADLRAAFTDTTPSMRPPSTPRPPTHDSAVVRIDDPSLRESGERGVAPRLFA